MQQEQRGDLPGERGAGLDVVVGHAVDEQEQAVVVPGLGLAARPHGATLVVLGGKEPRLAVEDVIQAVPAEIFHLLAHQHGTHRRGL